MRYLLLAVLCCISGVAHGIPLDSWTDWSVDQPYVSKQVPPGAMIVRGSGTDAYYVLEADPTTGELPVSLSGASISIDYSGVTGAAVPADAAYIGGNDAGTLRGVHVDSSGDLQVDVLSSSLPSGAATETTLSAINTKTPALGQALMAASTPVVIASNQSAIPVSQSGTWTVVTSSFPTTADTNYGTPGASTVRTAAMLGVGSTAVSNANPVPISDAGGIITVDGTVAELLFAPGDQVTDDSRHQRWGQHGQHATSDRWLPDIFGLGQQCILVGQRHYRGLGPTDRQHSSGHQPAVRH